MKTFKHFPEDMTCPICHTNNDAECWLMPVVGTEKENIVEAVPVHVECTGRPMIGRMHYDRDAGVVYCVVEG
jgi:RNA polymerase subunit RPABC4/transcription elongation factor Spt4